jgi:uncharacterized membrane protein
MNTFVKVSIIPLFILFCIAFPIAVIGVVFNVHPPFSMAWAASALLILEGLLVVFAIMDIYALFGLIACVLVGLLAYGIEALGVNTGFPFGSYRYTNVLLFHLPGNVPLPVVFAWLMIILSIYGMVNGIMARAPSSSWLQAVLPPLFALLLDLMLEPVAFHIEGYWEWLNPGKLNYYGVPLLNFLAWFIISFILLYLVNFLLSLAIPLFDIFSFPSRLAMLTFPLVFTANVLMFGLIDLTHGYYFAVVAALVAIALLVYIRPFPRFSVLLGAVQEAVEQDLREIEERHSYQPTRRSGNRKARRRRRKGR